MTYQVIYSDRAVETFDSIKEQINSKWGQKHTEIFERRVLQVVNLIQVSPFIFESVNKDYYLRRCVIHKNCSMFYEVGSFQITVHFFWDNRQDPLF
jgi:plasmid stabilization system protein ParE